MKTSGEAVKNKNDLLDQLTGDEKKAFEQAVKDGVIDLTMAHDLAGVSQGRAGTYNEKTDRVFRVASVMFHEAEKFNRGVTFPCELPAAKEAGQSNEAAAKTAVELVCVTFRLFSEQQGSHHAEPNCSRCCCCSSSTVRT